MRCHCLDKKSVHWIVWIAAAALIAGCSNSATSTEGGKGPTTGKPAAVKGAGSSGSPAAAAKQAVASSMPQLQGEHQPVFSLADNRLLAHLLRADGLFIPVGYPGIAKYLNFRRPWNPWILNKRLDDRRVALAGKTETWVHFPMSKALATSASHLVISLNSPKAQGLRLSLNGAKLESTRLNSGWQTVKVKLSAGTLRQGENKLSLRFGVRGRVAGVKAAAAVEWIYLGPKADLSSVSRAEPTVDGKLVLPAGGGLAYYISPHPQTKLRLRFAAQPAAKRCAVKTRLIVEGAEPQEVERSETALAAGKVAETFVDLAAAAGKVARLELWATGASCEALPLTAAELVRPGAAPTVARGPKPKNVLFWMIDNLRVDRLKLYNPETRVTTPVIDKLGQTGAVFERAYIQGTESRVSHAVIWTGMYPKQTRFVRPKAKLPGAYVTIAEALRKHGLYTACWTANGNISKFWGFAQGWSFFRNTLHKGGGLTGKALADHAVEVIEKQGDKPFYLYVGTIDPHVSWRGRQPWLNRYHPERYSGGPFKKNVMGPVWDKFAANPRKVSQADRKRALAIYDSTVSYNDHHLGRVLKALEAKGIRDETMIVITADHGEEFWEHGRIGHGGSIRETVVHVPLLIHYPPLFGKGVRVREGVDVASVMASILDAVGAPIPQKVQAASLLPLTHGVGAGYPRPAYATQYELAHTIRLRDYKLRAGGKDVRLYDLASEAKEHKNVKDQHPTVTRWLTDALSTFLIYQSQWRQARWGIFSNHLAAAAEELERGTAPAPIRP